MTEQKTIAVVGATGAQGGGLARAILDDPEGRYACRALTRQPTSDAARALAERGADVVQADLDDENNLTRAFQGAYGAYCMTNFFEHFSPEKELEQAANLARAAKAAGIRHAIWSTTEDSRDWVLPDGDPVPVLPGGYRVPHWDGKAQANRFFTDSAVPTSCIRAGGLGGDLPPGGLDVSAFGRGHSEGAAGSRPGRTGAARRSRTARRRPPTGAVLRPRHVHPHRKDTGLDHVPSDRRDQRRLEVNWWGRAARQVGRTRRRAGAPGARCAGCAASSGAGRAPQETTEQTSTRTPEDHFIVSVNDRGPARSSAGVRWQL